MSSGTAKAAKQFVESLRDKNPDIRIEKGKGGHWHVKRDGGLLGTIPSTPSDFRSLANSASYFRRIGLVVDEPPTRRITGPFGSQPRDAEQVEIAARVRKVMNDDGWTFERLGALTRQEAIRLGFVPSSTDHSAAVTIRNMLNEKRVSESFLDATRAALRIASGEPSVAIVSTPIPSPPPPPVAPEAAPEPAPTPVAPTTPPVVPKQERLALSLMDEFDSLAIRVLVRMAMGATTDAQLDKAVALAREVWELERSA